MKPANLILSLLRTYQHQGTSVKNIMDTGAMFGFNQNMMRVNLSRLVTRGLVVNTGRGHYRICEVADPVNQFVENWRAGENPGTIAG